MADATITQLTQAVGLTGAELIEIVQAGVSKRAPLSQVAALGGPPGPGFLFNNQATEGVPSGTTDNYSPAGYAPGTTNLLVLTPTDGTSALAGLAAAGVPPGFTLCIWNASQTVSLMFQDQASSTPANSFACPNTATLTLTPFSKLFLVYINGQWVL